MHSTSHIPLSSLPPTTTVTTHCHHSPPPPTIIDNPQPPRHALTWQEQHGNTTSLVLPSERVPVRGLPNSNVHVASSEWGRCRALSPSTMGLMHASPGECTTPHSHFILWHLNQVPCCGQQHGNQTLNNNWFVVYHHILSYDPWVSTLLPMLSCDNWQWHAYQWWWGPTTIDECTPTPSTNSEEDPQTWWRPTITTHQRQGGPKTTMHQRRWLPTIHEHPWPTTTTLRRPEHAGAGKHAMSKLVKRSLWTSHIAEAKREGGGKNGWSI